MVTLNRVRVSWSGWIGAPGVSTHYFAGNPPLAALRTLWSVFAQAIAPGITVTIENTGQTIDVATGKAVGTWAGATQTPITSAATGSYAAPAGAMVQWKTGAFFDGREVRGKTFIVPIPVAAYDSDGTIGASTLSTLNTGINTFLAGTPGMSVWSRKSQAAVTVTSGAVRDKVMVLRSRRGA